MLVANSEKLRITDVHTFQSGTYKYNARLDVFWIALFFSMGSCDMSFGDQWLSIWGEIGRDFLLLQVHLPHKDK